VRRNNKQAFGRIITIIASDSSSSDVTFDESLTTILEQSTPKNDGDLLWDTV